MEGVCARAGGAGGTDYRVSPAGISRTQGSELCAGDGLDMRGKRGSAFLSCPPPYPQQARPGTGTGTGGVGGLPLSLAHCAGQSE